MMHMNKLSITCAACGISFMSSRSTRLLTLGIFCLALACASDGPPSSLAENQAANTTKKVAWVALYNLTGSMFQEEFDKKNLDGYRVTSLSGYSDGDEPRYAAVWEKRPNVSPVVYAGLTMAEYEQEFDVQVAAGWRPKLVSGFNHDGQARYVAIFHPGSASTEWVARHKMTAAEFQAEFDALSQQGFRVAHVNGYELGGEARYSAIWEKRPGGPQVVRFGLDRAAYQAEFNSWTSQGYLHTLVNGYGLGGDDYYVAIWERPLITSGPTYRYSHHAASAWNFQTFFDNHVYAGGRLLQISGYDTDDGIRFAGIFEGIGISPHDLHRIDDQMGEFMTRWQVPGVAFALAKDERLVFARGWGHASIEDGELARPTNLFRIGSVSKTFTAAAVMQLMEGISSPLYKQLNQRVFGPQGALGNIYASTYLPWVTSIQIRHLLNHTQGGWVGSLGVEYDWTREEWISYVLATQPLTHFPGLIHQYSNFGYVVLGRIIEQKSSMIYEEFMRAAVLQPCGITAMNIGGNERSQRRENEVIYYHDTSDPYAINLAQGDAAGGWVASPIDLLRFIVRLDGFPNKPDIVDPATLQAMTTPPTGSNYGFGLDIFPDQWSHDGHMQGTRALLVRQHNGISYAMVANTTREADAYRMEFDDTARELANNMLNTWPAYDLF
jgi:CubicO group peptidase (beta-lactamase class C family)